MPATILTNCTMWLHDVDFTSLSSSVSLQMSTEDADVTVFGTNGYRSRAAGLKNVEANFEGFWEAAPDKSAFDNLAVGDQVASIAVDSAEGSKVFAFQSGRFTYDAFGSVGDPIPYTIDLQSSNTVGIVRGLVVADKANVTAIGVIGTPQQVGAGSAGKFLYAGIHVFGTPGTTMTVQVQSSSTLGGAYTTRATFPAITTAGGHWLTRVDATAFTDTFWRLNSSGTHTGTFNCAGWIALQ